MIKYRTFWRRFIAGIIDSLVFLPVSLASFWIQHNALSLPVAALAAWHVFTYLSWYAYMIIMHGKFGQTLGKMAMKVKVIDVSETQGIGYRQALLRDCVPLAISMVLIPHDLIQLFKGTSYLLNPGSMPDMVSTTLGFVFMGWAFLEAVTMLTNYRRRAVHDFIAGTVVVRTNAPDEHDPNYEQLLAGEKKKSRKIAIGCFSLILVFLAVCGGIGYYFNKKFTSYDSNRLNKPEQLNVTGVWTGAGFFVKSVYLDDPGLGEVTDLKTGSFVEGQENVLAVVSTRGAVFLDQNGERLRECTFKDKVDNMRLVTQGGESNYLFVNQGSWRLFASLIDADGSTRWEYGGRPGVNCMAAGDLDRDGKLDFAVGFNGGGGIHRVDDNGRKVWEQPGGNIWHVEIADTTGDGAMNIVHSDAGGRIYVRDAEGTVLSSHRPAPYFSDFSIVRWPDAASPNHCLLAEDDLMWIFDFDGSVKATFPAPYSGTVGHAFGTPFRFAEGDYLAVIVKIRRWETSILYVYDPAQELVYQEVLPEECGSILTVRDPATGADRILVGGDGKVYAYTLPGI